MSWQKTSDKDMKMMFIGDWLKKEFNFKTLCDRYKISRPTGYALVNRYLAEGEGALQQKSRAPHHIPHKTPTHIESILIKLKYRFPYWGPRKIRDYLLIQDKGTDWPASSTMGEIFKKHGLTKKRKIRKKVPAHSEPLSHCNASNQVWSADFKGQFYLSNAKYCYPLTITDNWSRYIFACEGFLSPTCDNVIKIFERAFKEFGLPDAIRTDNGQPFCGLGIGGLTRLSIWFLKLGIMPERIDLGAPQQNGRHERMHRTLKEATIIPGKYSLETQQTIFNNFIREFNFERPHEALQAKRPYEVYGKSKKIYPDTILEVYYPDEFLVRKVKNRGEIKIKGKKYYVSELLYKEPVGLEVLDEDRMILYFSKLKLGIVDLKLDKIIRP
jgi:putative transposase